MFNISKYATRHNAVVWLFVAIIVVGGIYSFATLGKREDSTFTIKSAMVVCPYPGATPEEVEALILEPLERELRTLRSVDQISSEAHFGYGELMVKLRPSTRASSTPQIWDELRRRIDNVRPKLPSDIGNITVADDFGDVYGIYYALVADEGFEWDEMREYAKRIERELYRIEGVDKIVLSGEQRSEVSITISPATLAMFDIRPEAIKRDIATQSSTIALGEIDNDGVTIELSEGTPYDTIADIRNQLLTADDGKQYRLGDIMRVEQQLVKPTNFLMRFDGRRAIGIAISTNAEMDIVAIGERITQTMQRSVTLLKGGHKNIQHSIISCQECKEA